MPSSSSTLRHSSPCDRRSRPRELMSRSQTPAANSRVDSSRSREPSVFFEEQRIKRMNLASSQMPRSQTPTQDNYELNKFYDRYYLNVPWREQTNEAAEAEAYYEGLNRECKLGHLLPLVSKTQPQLGQMSRGSSIPPIAAYNYDASVRGAVIRSPLTSRPTSRAVTPSRFDDEPPKRGATMISSRASTPGIPSYTDALCKVSQRLRQRSIPPPGSLEVTPTLYQTRAKRVAASPRRNAARMAKPPLPPQQESRKPKASEYYKNYVKSIYEREPLFNDFCNNLPAERRNFYNRDNLTQVKQEFANATADKWNRKGFNDPSVEHDIANKMYPWKTMIVKDEPASERLFRTHMTARDRDLQNREMHDPKLYVYHRSTWNRSDKGRYV